MTGLFSQFGHPGAPFGDRALVVPRFPRCASPEHVRSRLLHYYRMLDVANELRAEYLANRAPLEDLWGAGCVVRWCEACIEACREWLSATARRGGRGVVPAPLRDQSASVKDAQRRSESLTAVDPACSSPGLGGSLIAAEAMATKQEPGGGVASTASGSDITTPANRFFMASGMQELQPLHFKPKGA